MMDGGMMNGGMMAGCNLMGWAMWLGIAITVLFVFMSFFLFFRLVLAVEDLK